MNNKKPADIAMKNQVNRSTLLGRASSMTVAAAAAASASLLAPSDAQATPACFDPGPVNAVNLTTPQDCVVINDDISNAVVINTEVTQSATSAAVEVTATIGGRFVNNGVISNDGGTVNGIAFDLYGGAVNEGLTNAGLISSTSDTAIRLRLGGEIGDIENSGTISGRVGIDGAEGAIIQGDIVNLEGALIDGDDIGIHLHDYSGDAYLNGDIINDGTIEGGTGAIVVLTDTFESSIHNSGSGLIRSTDDPAETSSIAIFIGSQYAYTQVSNAGVIEGVDGGLVFFNYDFDGDIQNSGSITSNGSIGALRIGVTATTTFDSFPSASVLGSITNTGLIDGGDGWGIVIEADFIGETQEPLSQANQVNAATLFTGGFNIDNRGDIFSGIRVDGQEAVVNIRNFAAGVISSTQGGPSVALSLTANHLVSSLVNDGLIEGSAIGAMVGCDPVFSCKNVVNNVLVDGPEVLIDPVSTVYASIRNRGTISGGSTGLVFSSVSMIAEISNSGLISATGEVPNNLNSLDYESTTGLMITSSSGLCLAATTICATNGVMFATIENSGTIEGGNGLSIELAGFEGLGEVKPAILNTGSIIGESGTGLAVTVDYWYGDIVNSGLIDGADTGAYLYGQAFYGDFINNGDITGGQLTTGLHIAYSSYTGNVVNNDLLSAPGNALHIEADTFSGSIANTGTIVATGYSGTAVLLEDFSYGGYYDAGFTNTGLIEGGGEGAGIVVEDVSLYYGIVNDGGTITAETAIDTRDSLYGLEILNTGHGYVEGEVRFSEYFGDEYIGEDGGIRGDIIGTGGEGGYEANDDGVTVRDGDHYFIGKASALASFTVQSGGTAFLGTEGEWADVQPTVLSSPGSFYGSNIDELEVEAGGRLYMGEHADMSVETYTQSAYGELTYFLTSDESSHGQISNPGSLTGTATIGGTISVDLDVESFTGTTETSFTYEDMISTTSLSGTFSNASVIGSPFFELDVRYQTGGEGNPDTVDLLLSRVSFASLSCSTSTENTEALGQMLEDAFQAGDLTADQLALYLAILNSTDGCDAASTYEELAGTPFDFIAFQLDGPFKKMVGARIDSGRSTGCVVAGSSDCFNRYAADTTGSSTVMNDATPGGDPFAWLRNGVRQEGTSAVWGRGVGVWGETDGDSNAGAPGSRYNQKGGIVGADHVFSETFIAGMAAQYTDTDIKFPGHVDRVSVGSYEFGVYASYGDTQGYLNANTSYIWHNFDTYRQVFGSDTKGQFDGGTISACLEIGRIYEADGWRLQPVGVLSFASLSTDGYTENGTSTSRLVVKDSGFDSLKSILGGRLAYPVEMDSGRRWVPEVRVSWSHEFMDNNAEFQARLFSFAEDPSSYFTTKGAEYDRDSLNLGTGMNAPINEKIIVYLDYDATLSSDQTSHTASGGLRVLW